MYFAVLVIFVIKLYVVCSVTTYNVSVLYCNDVWVVNESNMMSVYLTILLLYLHNNSVLTIVSFIMFSYITYVKTCKLTTLFPHI